MAVITVSRELGSEGDKIANLVCQQLGYNRVDKDVFVRIVEDTGFDRAELEKLEGEFVKKPHFVSADMTSLYRKQPGAFQKKLALSEDAYRELLRGAVEEYARQGNAVIVGRGSQMILRNWPNALHVHLYAAPGVRARRIAARLGLSEADAMRKIQAADEHRRRYIRHMHNNANWKRLDYYHLAIDTGRICPDAAAKIVVGAARSCDEHPEECE